MKIHNLGRDYAYQQSQKRITNQTAPELVETQELTNTKEAENVGNQVQDRGEGEVVAEQDQTPTPKQKAKGRKKEAWTKKEQQEE